MRYDPVLYNSITFVSHHINREICSVCEIISKWYFLRVSVCVCNVRDYNSLLFNVFMKRELKVKIAQIVRVHEKLAM